MRRGTGTQAFLYDCPACNSRFSSSRLPSLASSAIADRTATSLQCGRGADILR